jgi:hypothetical protein
VQLAHAGDDGLVRLLIGVGPEGRILLGEAMEGLGEVDLRLGVDGLDGDGDDGVRDVDRGHRQPLVAVAEGVARVAVDAEHRDDVAGVGLGDVLLLVGVHAH